MRMKMNRRKQKKLLIIYFITVGFFGSILGFIGISSMNKARNLVVLTMTNQTALENASENIQTLKNLLYDCLLYEKKPDADMEETELRAKAEYEVEIVKLQELASQEAEEQYAAMETDYFLFVSIYNEVIQLCKEQDFEEAMQLFQEEVEPIAESMEEQLIGFADENTPKVENAKKRMDSTYKLTVCLQSALLILLIPAFVYMLLSKDVKNTKKGGEISKGKKC